MWCEMTAAGSRTPVLLQDKIFSRKCIPSHDFRHGHKAPTLHKVKNKPRKCDFVKNNSEKSEDAQLHLLGDKAGFIWKTKPSAIFLCSCRHTSKRKTD